jgi:hypothetical protein
MHSKEFHKLRSSANNIRMIMSKDGNTDGLCNSNRSTYEVLVGKPEWEKTF